MFLQKFAKNANSINPHFFHELLFRKKTSGMTPSSTQDWEDWDFKGDEVKQKAMKDGVGPKVPRTR